MLPEVLVDPRQTAAVKIGPRAGDFTTQSPVAISVPRRNVQQYRIYGMRSG